MITYCIIKFIMVPFFRFVWFLFSGLFRLIKYLCKPARSGSRQIKPAQCDPDPEKLERLEQQRIKQLEKARREQFKKEQAETELYHLEQQKKDLLQCYNVAYDQLKNAGSDQSKEKALRRVIAYNESIRAIDRKIEKNNYVLTG